MTAAAPRGPRRDDSLTPTQRASIDNAIWLCQSCSRMIDTDRARYTVAVLRDWKQQAEQKARIRTKARTPYRPIAPIELRTQLTPGEEGVLLALEEEFGCEVKTNIQVPNDKGWLNLDAAVVRGEDLVAIRVDEVRGGGLAYFQLEYLIDTTPRLTFPGFKKVVWYFAVVSDATEEQDEQIKARLNALASAAPFEVYIRMYRLRGLLATYNLRPSPPS